LNGEKGRWRGELFQNRAARLVRHLGYKEESKGKHGLDLISVPPPGMPGSNLHRPLFAPDGMTGFEFTCDANINEALVDEVTGKVKDAREKDSVPMVGGVLACDIRVSDKVIGYGEERSVYIWDVRDTSFLSHKVHEAELTQTFSNERLIDTDVTYLWQVSSTKRGSAKAKIAILFHHPLHEISLKEFKKAMAKVDASVTNILREVGLQPALVDTEIRCRGHYTEDLTSAQDVLEKFSNEEKSVYSFTRLDCFSLAPWSGFLPSD